MCCLLQLVLVVAGGPFMIGHLIWMLNFGSFSNNPPNLASVDDCMMFLMILHYTCTGLFSRGVDVIWVLLLDFGLRKKYPPYLLHAPGSEM